MTLDEAMSWIAGQIVAGNAWVLFVAVAVGSLLWVTRGAWGHSVRRMLL